MEEFINKIQIINTNITKSQQLDFTTSNIKNKQILVYYLYRILCKFKSVFILVSTEKELDIVYKALGVPDNLCYPLANKLSTNIEDLETIITLILNIFLKYSEEKGTINNIEKNKLDDFLNYKTSNDKKILTDFDKLNVLVPNLSKVGNKPSIEDINKYMTNT